MNSNARNKRPGYLLVRLLSQHIKNNIGNKIYHHLYHHDQMIIITKYQVQYIVFFAALT